MVSQFFLFASCIWFKFILHDLCRFFKNLISQIYQPRCTRAFEWAISVLTSASRTHTESLQLTLIQIFTLAGQVPEEPSGTVAHEAAVQISTDFSVTCRVVSTFVDVCKGTVYVSTVQSIKKFQKKIAVNFRQRQLSLSFWILSRSK